jgi:hypothetical protein
MSFMALESIFEVLETIFLVGWIIFFLFAGETKMATGGGRISLPLAVGVDHGRPQWPDLSIYFFFFGLLVHRRDK